MDAESRASILTTVDEVSITKELSGLESNRLMHLSFMADQKGLGGVAVHLHLHPHPQCCQHTHNTVHCFSHKHTSEQSSNLEKNVANFAFDTIEFKSAVEQVKAAIHKLKHQNPDLANINYPETVSTLASEVICDPTSSQSGQSSPNVSAASIEEFFPDEPNVSPQLNI